MTIAQLTEINGLYARYCRLSKLLPAKAVDPFDWHQVVERLRALGLEIDWDGDAPKEAA